MTDWSFTRTYGIFMASLGAALLVTAETELNAYLALMAFLSGVAIGGFHD